MSTALSKSEWQQLLALLHRFAEHDLDQFDAWRLDTSYGPVFVQLSRQLRADEPVAALRPVEPVAALRPVEPVAALRPVEPADDLSAGRTAEAGDPGAGRRA